MAWTRYSCVSSDYSKGHMSSSTVMLLLIPFVLTLSGCVSIGPKTVMRDRFDYNSAISDSWKEQALLNIVKLRYADVPVFMEVRQIVSSYSIENSISLYPYFHLYDSEHSTGGTVGSKYTDRPTITYSPLTGVQFIKSYMTPIPYTSLLDLIESGWPADFVLGLCVDSMNGLKNQCFVAGQMEPGDPEFFRAIQLFQKIKQARAMGMRIEQNKEKRGVVTLFFSTKDVPQETADDISSLKKALKLKPELSEFRVFHGTGSVSEDKITIVTRSVLHIMFALSQQIVIPERHAREQIVAAQTQEEKTCENGRFTIHSGESKPKHPYVAIRYLDSWFWVDQDDYRSKNTFSFLMLISSLGDLGDNKGGLPLVTIPAN